jgi:hypothetical protein
MSKMKSKLKAQICARRKVLMQSQARSKSRHPHPHPPPKQKKALTQDADKVTKALLDEVNTL